MDYTFYNWGFVSTYDWYFGPRLYQPFAGLAIAAPGQRQGRQQTHRACTHHGHRDVLSRGRGDWVIYSNCSYIINNPLKMY